MPNLCSNNIELICKNADSAKRLGSTLDNITCDKKWQLHEIEEHYNLDFNQNAPQPTMRADITNLYVDDNIVYIELTSAWSPAVGIFRQLAKKLNIIEHVRYVAEEPGMEIFQTNDETLAQDYYYVDSNEGFEVVDKDEAKELLWAYIQDHKNNELAQKIINSFDKEDLTITELNEFTNTISEKMSDDTFIIAHDYDYVDLQDQN